jgi:hypothetical protein
MPSSTLKDRLDSAKQEWYHAKAKYVLYDVFTRGDVYHPYRYVISELGVKLDGSSLGSWDIVIADKGDLGKGLLTPVLIEVKTQFSDNERLITDLVKKIEETEELIDNGNASILLSQMPTTTGIQLELNRDNLEYALFLPSLGTSSLINYIRSYTKQTKFKIGFVLWVFDNSRFDTNVISIPYLASNGIKVCKKIRNLNSPPQCNVCLCKHRDESLNRWFQRGAEQQIQVGGTLPPKLSRNWTDPAVAITIILASGMVIHSREIFITKTDLSMKIRNLYDYYKVSVKDNEIDSYISYMESMGILRVVGDIPLKPFRITNSVRDLLDNGDNLLEEIVKRAYKKKIDPSAGYFE